MDELIVLLLLLICVLLVVGVLILHVLADDGEEGPGEFVEEEGHYDDQEVNIESMRDEEVLFY